MTTSRWSNYSTPFPITSSEGTGDGAYNDATLQSYLQQHRSLQLLAPAKFNQAPKLSSLAQKQLKRMRLSCETVNAQRPRVMALVQALCTIRTQGLMTRIAASITAHSVDMMINSLLGRPALQ